MDWMTESEGQNKREEGGTSQRQSDGTWTSWMLTTEGSVNQACQDPTMDKE